MSARPPHNRAPERFASNTLRLRPQIAEITDPEPAHALQESAPQRSPPSRRSLPKSDFWACITMTAVFFFIFGGLVADALATYQTRHMQERDHDRQAQAQVAKP